MTEQVDRVGGVLRARRVARDHRRDALHPIARLDAQRRLAQLYVFRDGHHTPTAMIRYRYDGASPTRTAFGLVSDPRGSVRLVVRLNDGAVVQRLDYGPFGEVILDTNPGFQPATEHACRRQASAWRPWRFAPKIAGFAAGDANLFAYVGGDPVNSVDPSGLISGAILGGVCGCIGNVVFGRLGGSIDSLLEAGRACVVGAVAGTSWDGRVESLMARCFGGGRLDPASRRASALESPTEPP